MPKGLISSTAQVEARRTYSLLCGKQLFISINMATRLLAAHARVCAECKARRERGEAQSTVALTPVEQSRRTLGRLGIESMPRQAVRATPEGR